MKKLRRSFQKSKQLAMSEIADRIIACEILQNTEDLNILPEEQFGFIYQHSTKLWSTIGWVRHWWIKLELNYKSNFPRCRPGIRQSMARRLCLQDVSNRITQRHCAAGSIISEGWKFSMKVGNEYAFSDDLKLGWHSQHRSHNFFATYSSQISRSRKEDIAILALNADDKVITYQSRQSALVMRRLQIHTDRLVNWYLK